METPVIGITLDSEDAGGYSKFPWYALRQNYAGAVSAAGGLPLALPHQPDLVEHYLDLIHGLIITGGDFDVDPALFGANARHATVKTKDARTGFELAITKGALERDMPVLGICGGQQLLHVILGGKLIQHLADTLDPSNADPIAPIAHEQPNPRDQAGHLVNIVPGTLLHRIVDQDVLAVNSAHHQAAENIPDGIVINARAADGVIEGMEAPQYRFCLGVQWHPEFHICEGDKKIIEAFVRAAGKST